MIVRQPLDVMLKRVECTGCDDARLPHAAAEQFATAVCLGDERLRSGQRRTDRGAKTFAEAHIHRVEVLRPITGRNAAGDDCIKQPRAV